MYVLPHFRVLGRFVIKDHHLTVCLSVCLSFAAISLVIHRTLEEIPGHVVRSFQQALHRIYSTTDPLVLHQPMLTLTREGCKRKGHRWRLCCCCHCTHAIMRSSSRTSSLHEMTTPTAIEFVICRSVHGITLCLSDTGTTISVSSRALMLSDTDTTISTLPSPLKLLWQRPTSVTPPHPSVASRSYHSTWRSIDKTINLEVERMEDALRLFLPS